MIINASARTDIPAYFSDWFFQRLKEGYVYVRNPYYPKQITKYLLNEDVVDSLVFCSKNPQPMLSGISLLKPYHPYFFVTITPYGQEIEPHVPTYQQVIQSFQELSRQLGSQSVALRYDPIFLNKYYTIEKHLECFEDILSQLSGYTQICIISFIDLYAKTKKNFPGIQEVSYENQKLLAKAMSEIAQKYHIQLKTCAEAIDLSAYGIQQDGCISRQVLKNVIGCDLKDIKTQPLRAQCHCYPSRDIGEYNTCMHGCLYCYANVDKKQVILNYKRHDYLSPLLIGHVLSDDEIKLAIQDSYIVRQLS
ncbi:MAG: DUF1848 domain-containing protein, partial [Longibaculum sp.]